MTEKPTPSASATSSSWLPTLFVLAQILGAAGVWALLSLTPLALLWRSLLTPILGGTLGLLLLYPLSQWLTRTPSDEVEFTRTQRVLNTTVATTALCMGYCIVMLEWHWSLWLALVFPGGVVIGYILGFGVCLLGLRAAGPASAQEGGVPDQPPDKIDA